MAIDEGKWGVIIIESDSHRAFVPALSTKSSFDFGSSNFSDSILLVVSDEKEYEATNHWLLSDAWIFSFLT
jgi:hypothetical protein